MTHFKAYYYYLKNIRWILNNSLAENTIASSPITIEAQTESHLLKEKIKPATISDLEMWAEYKIKRLADEETMD